MKTATIHQTRGHQTIGNETRGLPVAYSPEVITALKDVVRSRLLDDDYSFGNGYDIDGADIDGARPGAPWGSESSIHARLRALLRDEAPLLTTQRFEAVLAELFDEVFGLGALTPVLADPSVTEVMLNGAGIAYVERRGAIEQVDLGLDETAILRIVERVIAPLGLRLDRSSPMVDARLPDGSRLHAVIPPLAIDGPCVTIRRFRTRPVTLDEFGAGAVGIRLLEWMVRAGWNVLVAGGTGAGKTTLLGALSTAIPPGERIVTIEETAELRLEQPHRVRLEARPANSEGAGAVSVRDLVRAALRMRPDRLIVGEVRGGEALDMIQALNTGHDGSLSTLHANGPAEALARLETLVLFADAGLPLDGVRSQIAASVDAVIFVARRPGGMRCIEAVGEVVTGNSGLGVRLLMTSGVAGLEPCGLPARPARRHDAEAFRGWDGPA